MRERGLLVRLNRDGYAIVPGALDAGIVVRVLRGLDEVPEDAAVRQRAGSTYGIRNLLRLVPELRALAATPAVRALVEPVLGPGAFVVRGLLFDKTPEANWKVYWHQDLTIAVRRRVELPGFAGWSVKAGVLHVQPPAEILERMVAVRLHLDDCGEANGPLRVLPGSHREGRLEPEAVRAWQERVSSVSCVAKAGDAVLMRPLLLHASSPAAAPAHRRVIHMEFAAEPLPGSLEWDSP